jgi:hypothetical protein
MKNGWQDSTMPNSHRKKRANLEVAKNRKTIQNRCRQSNGPNYEFDQHYLICAYWWREWAAGPRSNCARPTVSEGSVNLAAASTQQTRRSKTAIFLLVQRASGPRNGERITFESHEEVVDLQQVGSSTKPRSRLLSDMTLTTRTRTSTIILPLIFCRE